MPEIVTPNTVTPNAVMPDAVTTTDLDSEALAHLRALTGDPSAEFRDGQLEAIRALVRDRSRVLVVERTGWGKSAVYFIATRMLRDRGFGASFLVSPLIALMANQVESGARMGLRAAVVNSTNRDGWDHIRGRLEANEIDLLLVSEQRLNNVEFRRDWMPELGSRVGLVVVDEVHCISDWGHDFRPHYRRIGRFLQLLPSGVPVIGCTATANDRVIADVQSQLGRDLLTIRGPLGREGLRLEVHTDKRHPDQRLAWLARNIPDLPGTGIVYCLVRRDVEVVAEFLRAHGIDCGTYMGGGDQMEVDSKAAMLESFLANKIKCVVATSALGMGYDKPDVGFVIHYQMPQSAIAYYQQVGRAGRALSESYGILLAGAEDRDIQDWFIERAFPSQEEVEAVIGLLEEADEPTRRGQIAAQVNLATGRIDGLLTQLEVEGAVEKVSAGWQRTLAPWAYPKERVDRVNAWRREEQDAMERYAVLDLCRMQFLRGQLDDPAAEPCGICDVCRGERFGVDPESGLQHEADDRLRHEHVGFQPRKRWPAGLGEPSGSIVAGQVNQPGWCLTPWGAAGWGPLVKQGKQIDGRFAPELADALAEMITAQVVQSVEWITCVPSLGHPDLVPSLATEVGRRLGLPVQPVVRKIHHTEPQKEMRNSNSQVSNIWGSFEVLPDAPAGPCLLIDDIVDSRWTVTVVGSLLRVAGSGPVVPVGLAFAG